MNNDPGNHNESINPDADKWDMSDIKFNGRKHEKLNNRFLTGEYAAEAETILSDPEHIGANFSEVLVDGRVNKSDEQLLMENQGRGITLSDIAQARGREAQKMSEFREYVDSFGGNLKHARLHASPVISPFCLENSQDSNGDIIVTPDFIEQIQYLQKSGVEDIIITASLLHREPIDNKPTLKAPEGEQREKYIEMIEYLVDQVGDNVTIELGNETNMKIVTDKKYPTSDYIPPAEYADFYKDVAGNLKKKHSDLKLAIAGTSFADRDYLKLVLENINDDSIVDRISIHPYRRDVNSAPWTGEREDGFGWGGYNPESYDEAEDDIIELAKAHQTEFFVGEVQFGSRNDQFLTGQAREKTAISCQNSAKKGITSFIWPGDNLPF